MPLCGLVGSCEREKSERREVVGGEGVYWRERRRRGKEVVFLRSFEVRVAKKDKVGGGVKKKEDRARADGRSNKKQGTRNNKKKGEGMQKRMNEKEIRSLPSPWDPFFVPPA